MTLLERIDLCWVRMTPHQKETTGRLLKEAANEIKRLQRGDFTEEEFQNLCHNFSEDDAARFRGGCEEYQRKLFGEQPVWAVPADAESSKAFGGMMTVISKDGHSEWKCPVAGCNGNMYFYRSSGSASMFKRHKCDRCGIRYGIPHEMYEKLKNA